MDAGREQAPADAQHETQSNGAENRADGAAMEEHPVPRVRFHVVRVLRDNRSVFQLPDVVEDVAPLDLPEAFERRAVRIAFLIGKRVVLEVDGHPLGGHDPGRHPDAEPEHPLNRGMQHDCAMGRRTVQVDGRAEDRDLGDKGRHNQRNDQRKQHDATLRQTRLLLGNPLTCGGVPTKGAMVARKGQPLRETSRNAARSARLPVPAFEVPHEIDQRVDAVLGKSVVD